MDDAQSSPSTDIQAGEDRPTLASSVSETPRAEPQPADELYRVSLNTTVKPYKNAQNRTGESLGVFNINVSSLDAFRVALFEVASQNVVGIAIAENSGFSLPICELSQYVNCIITVYS